MKNHKGSSMKRNINHSPETPFKVRESAPILMPKKDGVQVLCPFCKVPHPILPGQDATCGTSLRVMAVQTIIPSRVARLGKLTCLKCHKGGGGDMVRYANGYIHLEDCAPATRLLAEPPKFSRLAKIIYQLPARVRKLVEKRTGRAQAVEEIDPEGKETGKVLGYFFLKAKV